MKAIEIKGITSQALNGIDTFHAEIKVQYNDSILYVQAHDNGVNRYYCVSKMSYFMEQSDNDDDFLEEYSTCSVSNDSNGFQNLEFIDFLENWENRLENKIDRPYYDSLFYEYFEMADRMLDCFEMEIDE